MPIPQDDRIAFSQKIVSADQEIRGLQSAKTILEGEVAKLQKLDTANKNLFTPVNTLVNSYQSELAMITGTSRTTIVEQDILDSANKKIQNHFFPNDTSVSVPSLSALNNVWGQVKPFALTYAIGKNYTEAYAGSVTKEQDLVNAVLTLITSAADYTDIQNTSGQRCSNGTCSLPQYLTQVTCEGNAGIWTPAVESIVSYTAIQSLKTSLVTAVNTLKTFVTSEVAVIPTNDTDSAKQNENDTAIANINTTLLGAVNTWLGYSDFNTAHGQTTCAGFNGYNANLLAPTKLHSTQLTALQTALNNRLTFLTTRVTQVTANLGTITQNVSTGALTSSTGLYGRRYGFLVLRLNGFGGSLIQLSGLQTATSAQDGIVANIESNKAIYQEIIPTTALKANANGGNVVHVIDASFLSVGDSVYVCADNQDELKRAIKAISGTVVTLNDVVPAKYKTSEKARLYKDLT